MPAFMRRFLRRRPFLVHVINNFLHIFSILIITVPACFIFAAYQDISVNQALIRAFAPDADPAALTKQEVFDLQRGGYALMAAALVVMVFTDYQYRHGELTTAWTTVIWIVCGMVYAHGAVLGYGKALKVGKATPKTLKEIMEEAVWSGYQGVIEL